MFLPQGYTPAKLTELECPGYAPLGVSFECTLTLYRGNEAEALVDFGGGETASFLLDDTRQAEIGYAETGFSQSAQYFDYKDHILVAPDLHFPRNGTLSALEFNAVEPGLIIFAVSKNINKSSKSKKHSTVIQSS